MNIEEAKKVLWLKTNPRPIGELLAEGILTKENLEWASTWAYNPALKQAAGLLLDSMNEKPQREIKPKEEAKTPHEVGITLEKARTTAWPFSPHKGKSMGELVDSKQLSLKDLGYAIENAFDEKVRQAATLLSLIRLEQVVKEPVPDAGFVNIVSGGRSYAERQEVRLTFLQGIILGFTFASLVIVFIWLAISSSNNGNSSGKTFSEVVSTPAGILALIILIVLVIFSGWLIAFIPEWISKRFDKAIEEHRFGQEGEERTLQSIIQALDGNWSVFQNVTLPGKKSDLDLVLVGPPGVWVLEVKNFRGKYRNIGERWEYSLKNKWKSLSKSPSQQAFQNAVRLGNFLKADKINTFVTPVIVWANKTSPLAVENPTVGIWEINHLQDELGNIWQGEKVSKEVQKQIEKKLAVLCEKQKQHS